MSSIQFWCKGMSDLEFTLADMINRVQKSMTVFLSQQWLRAADV